MCTAAEEPAGIIETFLHIFWPRHAHAPRQPETSAFVDYHEYHMNVLRHGLAPSTSSLLSLSARHVALALDSVMETRLGRLFTAAPSCSATLCSAAGSSRCFHNPARSWRHPVATVPAPRSASCHHSTPRSRSLASELSSRSRISRISSHAVSAAQAAEAEPKPVLQNQQYDGGRVIKVDIVRHTRSGMLCPDCRASDGWA